MTKTTCIKVLLFIIVALFTLTACVNTSAIKIKNENLSAWLNDALDYTNELAPSHPHHRDQIFQISDDMRRVVHSQFSHYPKDKAIHKLADWLLARDGHGMDYDVHANLAPLDAYKQRRGNCLSFTLLITRLASELDIEMQFNEVDLPGTWEVDETNELILYRHINAIYQAKKRKLIFDLAMDEYDYRLPQRTITENHALALLHSNLAVESLKEKNYDLAAHHMKLAVGANQFSSDIWVNIGVFFNRSGEVNLAEHALLYALEIDKRNSSAAGNLEQLYLENNKNQRAAKYARLAKSARSSNPYYQFRKAQDFLEEKKYQAARQSIYKAKRIHNKDSRFFFLSSKIESALGRYSAALKDIETAYNLSIDEQERNRFKGKTVMLAQAIQKRKDERAKNAQRIIQFQRLNQDR